MCHMKRRDRRINRLSFLHLQPFTLIQIFEEVVPLDFPE